MDKRIKEIKRMWHEDGDINDETFYWAFYWLIQQAERVRELENQLHQAQAKAERYKQALEFYADKENYRGYLTAGGWVKTPVNDDDGEKARKALE